MRSLLISAPMLAILCDILPPIKCWYMIPVFLSWLSSRGGQSHLLHSVTNPLLNRASVMRWFSYIWNVNKKSKRSRCYRTRTFREDQHSCSTSRVYQRVQNRHSLPSSCQKCIQRFVRMRTLRLGFETTQGKRNTWSIEKCWRISLTIYRITTSGWVVMTPAIHAVYFPIRLSMFQTKTKESTIFWRKRKAALIDVAICRQGLNLLAFKASRRRNKCDFLVLILILGKKK